MICGHSKGIQVHSSLVLCLFNQQTWNLWKDMVKCVTSSGWDRFTLQCKRCYLQNFSSYLGFLPYECDTRIDESLKHVVHHLFVHICESRGQHVQPRLNHRAPTKRLRLHVNHTATWYLQLVKIIINKINMAWCLQIISKSTALNATLVDVA